MNYCTYVILTLKAKIRSTSTFIGRLLKIKSPTTAFWVSTIIKALFEFFLLAVINIMFKEWGISRYIFFFYLFWLTVVNIGILNQASKILDDPIVSYLKLAPLNDRKVLIYVITANMICLSVKKSDNLIPAVVMFFIMCQISALVCIALLEIALISVLTIKTINSLKPTHQKDTFYYIVHGALYAIEGIIGFRIIKLLISASAWFVRNKSIINESTLESLLSKKWYTYIENIRVAWAHVLALTSEYKVWLIVALLLCICTVLMLAYMQVKRFSFLIRKETQQYCPSNLKTALCKLYRRICCDKHKLSTVFLKLLYRDKNFIENNQSTFLFPIDVMLELLAINLILGYITDPFWKLSIIFYCYYIIVSNIANTVALLTAKITRYDFDAKVLGYYRLSGFDLKELHKSKENFLETVSTLPCSLATLASAVICIWQIKPLYVGMSAAVIMLFMFPVILRFSVRQTIFMAPYILSKYYKQKLEGLSDFSEFQLYDRFYVFYKNFIIMPPFFIMVSNTWFRFIPDGKGYLFFVCYIVYFIAYCFIVHRENLRFIDKGVYEIEKLNLEY